jgi:signal transduction histidine kinase
MSAAFLPHVFEPFVRGSKRTDGYGLGLATVKRLVDAHRGTIRVESEEGRGTTFVVLLPAATLPPPPSEARQRGAGASAIRRASAALQHRPS